ncbi:MAG: hypothetical protein AABX17_03475 [Nanoarchaeota archaeon]
MKIRNIKHLYQSKNGWLRIVEAFISVLLVMGVVLIIIERNQPEISAADEIGKLQKYVLDYVTTDEILRSQVIGGYLGGVNDKLKVIIPVNFNYSIRVCNYNEICSLSNGSMSFVISDTEVYSDEALIFANLTYYNPLDAKKLKLFFWEGNYPNGITPQDYYSNKPVASTECIPNCAGKVCGGSNGCSGICLTGTCSGTDVCTNGACVAPVAGTAVLSVTFNQGGAYTWVNPATGITNKRIDWDITIRETAGVEWLIDNGTECWKVPPPDYSGKTCRTSIFTDGRKATINQPYVKNSYAYTTTTGNTYNLTYYGHDTNGHYISTNTYTINFP